MSIWGPSSCGFNINRSEVLAVRVGPSELLQREEKPQLTESCWNPRVIFVLLVARLAHCGERGETQETSSESAISYLQKNGSAML